MFKEANIQLQTYLEMFHLYFSAFYLMSSKTTQRIFENNELHFDVAPPGEVNSESNAFKLYPELVQQLPLS